MSRIIKHNGTIYVCGQVAADATKDVTVQTQIILEKVDDLLQQALIISFWMLCEACILLISTLNGIEFSSTANPLSVLYTFRYQMIKEATMRQKVEPKSIP